MLSFALFWFSFLGMTYCGVEIIKEHASFSITSRPSYEWSHSAVDTDIDFVQWRKLLVDAAFDTNVWRYGILSHHHQNFHQRIGAGGLNLDF